MPGGVSMPVASTVVRLPDRTLLVYSPVAFDDRAVAAIEAEGEVAHIVVPSLLHHMFAGPAAARWPRATVHAPAGIAGKQPALRVDRSLARDVDGRWGEALDCERVDGVPRIDEHVLFHRASATLICADLVFNLTRPSNLRTRFALAVMGVGGRRLAQSRAWRAMRSDRAAARASVERILGWPIARVAPCHGEPCEVRPVDLAARMTRLCGRGAPASG